MSKTPGSQQKFGSASRRNAGTAAGQVPVLDSAGRMPPVDGSQMTNIGSIGAIAPHKFRSTNALLFPAFSMGVPWNVVRSSAAGDMIIFGVNTSSPAAGNGFFNRVAQLAASVSALHMVHPFDFAIDKTKDYRAGLWGFGGPVNLILTLLQNGGGDISSLTNALTLPATADLSSGELAVDIVSGSWPGGTIGGRFKVENTVIGTNKYLFYGYLIKTEQLPFEPAIMPPGSKTTSGGGGTHEGAYDVTENAFYTISHTYNRLTKMSVPGLVRINSVPTDLYPHDLIVFGQYVWVVCFNGQKLQQFDKTTLALVNTFAIPGPKSGIGVCHDGTNIIVGCGVAAEGGAQIQKLTIGPNTWNLISADVEGTLSNVPVVVRPSELGVVWSVHSTNSQVKKISIPGGTTLGTVNCTAERIYGLGTDGTFIFANCDKAVIVIDPATATIVRRYDFQHIFGGASNIRPDVGGRMWFTTSTGVGCLDHARGRLWEFPNVMSGGPKWSIYVPGIGQVFGSYSVPVFDCFQ